MNFNGQNTLHSKPLHKSVLNLVVLLFMFFSVSVNSQSFVFNLTGQNFTFLNTNKTIITGGNTVGSVHRYDNVATVAGRIIYARVTILAATNATVVTFDEDAAPGTPAAFQPVISSTAANGVAGFISYRLEFFDTATNIPAYLNNFNLSGLDIDGNSTNQRELYQIRDFTSYQVNNPTGLTISPAATFTQFLGIASSLGGITFDNSAAFISFYGNSKTSVDVNLGSTGTQANRQFSMVLGTVPGTFTTPQTTNNATAFTQTDLQITKVANTMSPVRGGAISFTLTATNAGTSNATNVQVADLLPNGYTFTNATPSVGIYNNTSGFWNIGTLNSGATATLTINATVNETGTYANSAGITGNEIDPNTANNGSTITPVPVSQANLGITKTINNPNPAIGSTVQFTLVATNAGLSNATGVVVNDLLPSGYTFVSASTVTGGYNNTTGVWTIGNFANGANATLTINAIVRPNGNYTNNATISGSQIDTNSNNNSSSVTIPITLTNTCPTSTVNLNTAITITNSQSGTTLTWHTGTPATNANQISNLTAVSAGTYYAAFYDSIGNCYGPVSGIVNVVTTNCIDAVNDGPTTVATAATPTTVQNVTANDTLNGVVVTAANTDVTPITTGPLSIDANGVLTLAPNTPSGTYTITYQLCEVGANPANCDTAVATVVVANPIDAVNDGPVTVASTNAVVTAVNALTNDTLAGIAATTNNTNVTPLTNGPLSIDANGIVTVAANTPSGTYTITYQLCEANPSTGLNVTPANCDTAIATVVVANPIDAVNDGPVTVASTNAVVTAVNALTNDTLAGIAATTNNTNVTPLTSGPLSIDANGIVTVAANTPSGTYTITYQLCEANPSTGLNVTPANCDTAVATVVVANPIDAVNDGPVTVASTNAVVTAVNALTNDTLAGIAATTTNTNVTPLTSGPLSIDANGIVTVAANTPSGTYTITYQLCEANPSTGLNVTPANCDTAVATVVVANPIDAVNDGPVTVASTNAVVTAVNALTNDTLAGIAATTTNTNVTPLTSGPLSIDANGIVTVAANTPSGTYTITYQLCEANPSTGLNVTPANCDTAIATVVVANPIDAVNDGPVTVASTNAVVTAVNALTNDTLAGIAATTTNTNVTPLTSGPLSIDANGIVTVAANTPSGTYTITYQLCEANPSTGANVTPANCDTAVATVVVANPIVRSK